jgi:hypothetical protein
MKTRVVVVTLVVPLAAWSNSPLRLIDIAALTQQEA